eukprot:Nk52_evm5s261 gene=Nk52_evmTU5s261
MAPRRDHSRGGEEEEVQLLDGEGSQGGGGGGEEERGIGIWMETNNNNNMTSDKRPIIRIFFLSMIIFGLEVSYSIETAYVTGIFLQLGFSHTGTGFVWLISPLMGLFLQPVLGWYSDQCRSRYGRRRPFITALTLGSIVGFILLPNAKGIGSLLCGQHNSGAGDDSWSHRVSVGLAVFAVVLLDFCNDSCQAHCRSYLLDVVPLAQQEAGNSIFSVMAGSGSFFGFVMGSIHWKRMFEPLWDADQERVTFTCAALMLAVCLGITICSIKEKPNTDICSSEPASTMGILKSLASSSQYLKWVLISQFLGMTSYLSFLLFYTDFVAEAVFGGSPDAADEHKHELYKDGLRFGSFGLACGALSSVVYGAGIPLLMHHIGMKATYFMGYALFCILSILTALFPNTYLALGYSCAGGVLFATIYSIPFCVVASHELHSSSGQLSSREKGRPTETSPMLQNSSEDFLGTDPERIGSTPRVTSGSNEENRIGLHVGLMNMMQFLGQLFMSLTIGLCISKYESTSAIGIYSFFFSLLGSLTCLFVKAK